MCELFDIYTEKNKERKDDVFFHHIIMKMKITTEQLIEIVANVIQCNITELNEDSGIGVNAQWDSLRHVMIMAELEERFGLKVNENNIDFLMTIKTIKEYINNMES